MARKRNADDLALMFTAQARAAADLYREAAQAVEARSGCEDAHEAKTARRRLCWEIAPVAPAASVAPTALLITSACAAVPVAASARAPPEAFRTKSSIASAVRGPW